MDNELADQQQQQQQSKSSSLAILQQLTEEIPSGVSPEDVGRILEDGPNNPNETANYIAQSITGSLKKALEYLWKEQQIDQKLQSLQTTESLELYDVRTVKMENLQRKKQYLEKMLTKTNAELDEYYNYIMGNIEEIKKLEEAMKRD